ncbi:hypothetical protein [Oceanobacillus iheyensis HTE831]|uniref:Histone deacetylase n=1 Tax=Oceanobacillus iheyensis (strain DSM 14371 / CIP 107618 / JCM 11309 / KCTC 3954 / HTE831) TaxID=221109 RepID=Q8CUV4_OCEIH|nr:hypothetical protein [Oceanobacillus iheyensis]BAC12959.1 hypothetical protein [Oceanobacillus iheyensis HTE831]
MEVWYSSYGSNLCEERFYCYILGLQPYGSNKVERGCRNKTLPRDNKKIILPYQLYFAKERSKWGKGGVAFIHHEYDISQSTIGRMYRITEEQFLEVVAQENQLEDIYIDLSGVKKRGFADLELGWYDRIIYLGEEDGSPIFTFTNSNGITEMEKYSPAIPYQNIIRKGLSELGLDKIEINSYLSPFHNC